MAATKEQYDYLFEQIDDIEAEIKDQNADKKEKFDLFSEQHGIHIKALKKMYSDHKDFMKNEAEFHMVDADYEVGMDVVLGKRATEVVLDDVVGDSY